MWFPVFVLSPKCIPFTLEREGRIVLLVHLCGAAVNNPLSRLLLASKRAAASSGSNSHCELERLAFKAPQKIKL